MGLLILIPLLYRREEWNMVDFEQLMTTQRNNDSCYIEEFVVLESGFRFIILFGVHTT